jgi:hypothetical protein
VTAPVSASTEVLRHHADRHPCRPRRAVAKPCPCGAVAVLVCEGCGDPLFLMYRTWCAHAAELLAACHGGGSAT